MIWLAKIHLCVSKTLSMSKWRATSNGGDWGQTRPNDGLLTIYPGVVEQPPLSIHLHHGPVAGTHEGAVVTLDDDDTVMIMIVTPAQPVFAQSCAE